MPRTARRTPPFVSESLVRCAAAVCFVAVVTPAVLRYAMPHKRHLALARVLYGEYADTQLLVLASHPVCELLHRLGGAAYLMLGAMQFSTPLRRRHLQLHRVTGYVFSLLSYVAASSGMYFALTCPYHRHETAPSLLFGAFSLFALMKALQCIRSKPPDIQGHKEWMTRSYNIGLAVGLIRLGFLFFHYVVGLTAYQFLAFGFWLCWVLMLVGTEAWIQASRKGGTSTWAAVR